MININLTAEQFDVLTTALCMYLEDRKETALQPHSDDVTLEIIEEAKAVDNLYNHVLRERHV